MEVCKIYHIFKALCTNIGRGEANHGTAPLGHGPRQKAGHHAEAELAKKKYKGRGQRLRVER